MTHLTNKYLFWIGEKFKDARRREYLIINSFIFGGCTLCAHSRRLIDQKVSLAENVKALRLSSTLAEMTTQSFVATNIVHTVAQCHNHDGFTASTTLDGQVQLLRLYHGSDNNYQSNCPRAHGKFHECMSKVEMMQILIVSHARET